MMSIKSWTSAAAAAVTGTASMVVQVQQEEEEPEEAMPLDWPRIITDQVVLLEIPLTVSFPRKCPRSRSPSCTTNSIIIENMHSNSSRARHWRQRQRSKSTIHQQRIHAITSMRHHQQQRQEMWQQQQRRKSTFGISRFSTRSSTRSNTFSTKILRPSRNEWISDLRRTTMR